jgi:hypothetical protein
VGREVDLLLHLGKELLLLLQLLRLLLLLHVRREAEGCMLLRLLQGGPGGGAARCAHHHAGCSQQLLQLRRDGAGHQEGLEAGGSGRLQRGGPMRVGRSMHAAGLRCLRCSAFPSHHGRAVAVRQVSLLGRQGGRIREPGG